MLNCVLMEQIATPTWSGARAGDIKRGAGQTNEERPTNRPTRPQSTISSFYGAAMATSVGGCSKRLRDQNNTATASGGKESRGGDCRLALHPFAFDKVIFTVLASRQQQGHFSPSPTRQRSVSDGPPAFSTSSIFQEMGAGAD